MDSTIELTPNELRQLRFIGRSQRIAALAVAALWLVTGFSIWYKMSTILEHGGAHGLFSYDDLWTLVNTGSSAGRMFAPYEVFVFEQAFAAWYGIMAAFIMSIFVVASTVQSRLTHKLWQIIQSQHPEA